MLFANSELESSGFWFGLIGIFITIMSAIIASMLHVSTRLTKVELITEHNHDKINSLEEFLVHRALSQAVIKGMGSFKSPFKLNTETAKWYDFIAEELKTYYKTIGYKLSDLDLFMAISKNFGPKILKTICINHNLTGGECILGAMAVAKGMETIEFNLDNFTS